MAEPVFMTGIRKWLVEAGKARWFFSDYKAANDFYQLNKEGY